MTIILQTAFFMNCKPSVFDETSLKRIQVQGKTFPVELLVQIK